MDKKDQKGFGREKKVDEKLLYTVDEVARILNIKISRVRMAIFRKEISYVKLGALVRFRTIDIENFINKNLVVNFNMCKAF